MGDWAKIIYDKMPMLYGQIMMQKYLDDPSVSFCAIGDALKDKSPLQVSSFAKGKEIDTVLPKIFLEGGGGHNQKESYELAAYFYDNFCLLESDVMPFMFITGDEGFFPSLEKSTITSFLGSVEGLEKTQNSSKIFWELQKKFNLFLLKKEYSDPDDELEIYTQWAAAIGKERILTIKKPKSCVDTILGAIAITSGKRDLDGYMNDLRERDQNEERMKEVYEALKLYDTKVKTKEVKIVYNKSNEIKDEVLKIIAEGEDREKVKYYDELRALNRKMRKGQIPEKFMCPIMKELFMEPVTASDGRDYERKALEIWLKNNKTSPVDESRELSDTTLKGNIPLRKEVRAFVENPPKAEEKKKEKDGGCLIF